MSDERGHNPRMLVQDHVSEFVLAQGAEITLNFPWATQSLNKTIRTHWSKRRTASYGLDVEIEWRLWLASHGYHQIVRLGKRRRSLSLTRLSPRFLDFDNFVGGAKPLIDALVNARIIFDDSPEWLHSTYEQKLSNERRTVAVIAPHRG